MAKFKGTWIFALVVTFAVGVMVYDYKSQQAKEAAAGAEKQLLPDFKIENLESLSFVRGNSVFKIEKIDGSLQMLEPVKDSVSSGDLESYLSGLASQEIRTVEVEGDVDWGVYGLSDPDVTLTIKEKGQTRILRIGTVRAYDEGYYLKINDEKKLLLSGSSLSPYVSKSANDLRAKDLYVGSTEYRGLDILTKTGRLKFALTDGRWQLASSKNLKISDSAINDYINVIRHMQADAVVSERNDTDIVKKYGLAKPELVIDITAGSETETKSWTAKFSAEKNGEVFVDVGSPRPIYRLQPRKLDSLRKTADDFRNREFPFAFDHVSLTSLSIKPSAEAETLKLIKRGGVWLVEGGKSEKEIVSEKVERLLNDIRQLKVDSFLTGSEANKKLSSSGSIEAFVEEEKLKFSFVWGEERTKQGGNDLVYLAKTTEFDENFSISKDSVARIAALDIYKVEEPIKTEVTPEETSEQHEDHE